MLIEFSVQNFRSIKEKQTLSLVSASSDELRATNTVPMLNDKLNLLRSVAIYGPNASGKTNLIKGLQTMRRIVLNSARSQRGDEVGVKPYLFDLATQKQPTEFAITFIEQNIRYQYGFLTTDEQVLEEWLFAYPKGRPQTWIDRKFDQQTQEYKWGHVEKLVGTKQLWQEATRSNALFLSTAIQLNNSQLQPVFDWFKLRLKIISGDLGRVFTADLCEDEKKKSQIINFLQAADFHISDLKIENELIELDKFLPDRPKSRELLTARFKDVTKTAITKMDVRTIHTGSQGDKFVLDLNEESDGTQKFFAYAGRWLDVLKNGYVLIVDELNDNLHPNLVRFMVQMFHDNTLNCENAQLIFTTHETSILSQEVFRRDQIWFVEKDEYNATTLYPLSDFSPRKDAENLEKNYFQGRYGALPYFRSIANLFEVCE